MFFNYQNCNINYTVEGTGYPVIILHGWGTSLETMSGVAMALSQNLRVYNIDFPGFGKSEEPSEAWGTSEYADMVAAFIIEEKLNRPIILAHSFGGRVALHLGSRDIVGKMIITGGAGIPPKRGMDYYAKVYSYKAMKKALDLPIINKKKTEILAKKQKSAGSTDYQNASGIMRQIFVKAVNEDLRPLIPKVTSSTILFWGKNDTATPLSDGEYMEKNMKDAGLIAVNGTHYAFLENLNYFICVVESFLANEMRGE